MLRYVVSIYFIVISFKKTMFLEGKKEIPPSRDEGCCCFSNSGSGRCVVAPELLSCDSPFEELLLTVASYFFDEP